MKRLLWIGVLGLAVSGCGHKGGVERLRKAATARGYKFEVTESVYPEWLGDIHIYCASAWREGGILARENFQSDCGGDSPDEIADRLVWRMEHPVRRVVDSTSEPPR